MMALKTFAIFAVAGVLLSVLTVGCDEPAAAPPPSTPTTSAPASGPVAAVAPANADDRPAMTGIVTDAAGKPIEGAQVFADAALYYNTNLEARTDKDGRYRIDLPQANAMHTTWRPYGYLTREYHGKSYRFDLHPLDDAPFAGDKSVTRDFQWRLTGAKPEGRGQYGSHVVAYTELGSDLMPENVELTLVPDGPLIDGSAGKTIRGKLESTGEGSALADVPVGRYRITAQYAPKGDKPASLLVRWRNKGEHAKSLTADFDNPNGPTLPIHRIDLEVKRVE